MGITTSSVVATLLIFVKHTQIILLDFFLLILALRTLVVPAAHKSLVFIAMPASSIY